MVPAKLLQLSPTLCDPLDCTHQAPPTMRFLRQEYGSGVPCPPPGDLPDPGIEPTPPVSPALVGSLLLAPLGKLSWCEKKRPHSNKSILGGNGDQLAGRK